MREELRRYYFTYGDDPEFPFHGGWTEVIARNMTEAISIFRSAHKDRLNNGMPYGLVNCDGIYTQEQFMATDMSKNGNKGFYCHERFDVEAREKTLLERIVDLTATLQNAVLCYASEMEALMKVEPPEESS